MLYPEDSYINKPHITNCVHAVSQNSRIIYNGNNGSSEKTCFDVILSTSCTYKQMLAILIKFITHRGTRSHLLKLFYPDLRVSVRAHCFPIRVIMLWNRLPASIVLAENIHLFKNLLRQVDFSYAMLGKD